MRDHRPTAPDVTVVIPTHNRRHLLRTALWSVLRQDTGAPSVIVVDDGSSDETPALLSRTQHPAVTTFRHDLALGVSRSRNEGLAQVRTTWVAFLDDDDVWDRSHLSGVLDAIARRGEGERRIDVGYSGSVKIDLSRRLTGLRPAPLETDLPESLYVRNDIGTPSRVLLRTEAVREAGGFDEQLSLTADWDLWLRLVGPDNMARSAALSVGYTEHGDNMHLAADLALEELPRLEQRYAEAAHAEMTAQCAAWLAACYRRSGQRFQAARWYVKSFRRDGERRDLGRAVGVLLGERAIRMSGLKRSAPLPAGAGRWLEEARRIDQLPADDLPWESSVQEGISGEFLGPES